MNIIRKGFLATAAAATLAFGAAGSAQAHAFADSILNVSNLRFLNSAGAQFTAADFTTLVVDNTSSATATFNALTLNAATGPICAGTCPGGVNGPLPGTGRFTPFPAATLATLPNATFGFGDTSLTGSALEPGGANASTRATASVSASPNTTAGTANTGTTSSFVFSLGAADSMTVAFDADAHTVAQVPIGTSPVSVAAARLSWSIRIINLDDANPLTSTVLSYSPNQINGDSNVSRTHAFAGTTAYDFAGFLSATSALLTAGTNYQLTIQHSTFADARQEEIPEPATLAIVAAGLLSMSLVSRRRKS